jgi:hypothetical protein
MRLFVTEPHHCLEEAKIEFQEDDPFSNPFLRRTQTEITGVVTAACTVCEKLLDVDEVLAYRKEKRAA